KLHLSSDLTGLFSTVLQSLDAWGRAVEDTKAEGREVFNRSSSGKVPFQVENLEELRF
ncbi:hypothetical protein JEQ12_012075, partial [Ovis aries]